MHASGARLGARLSKIVANAGSGTVVRVRDVGPVSTLDMGRFGMLSGVSVAERRVQQNLLRKVTQFSQLKLHPTVRANLGAVLEAGKPPTPVQKVALKTLGRAAGDTFVPTLIAAETGSGKTLAYLAPLLSDLLGGARASSTETEEENPAENVAENAKVNAAQSVAAEVNPANSNGAAVGAHVATDASATTDIRGSGAETENAGAPLAASASQRRRNRSAPAGGISSIVLVPTLELAAQVCADARALAPPLVVEQFAGAESLVVDLARGVAAGVDLAVGTPGKFLKLHRNYPCETEAALRACRTLVVDEADSLMAPKSIAETLALVDRCPRLQSLVFVTATIPRSFDKYLRTEYPRLQRLVTPSIHRLPRHIDFRVVEVWRKPYCNSKDLALRQLLFAIYHDNTEPGRVKRAVVFVNQKESMNTVARLLNDSGFDATSLDMDPQRRAETIKQFKRCDALKSGVLKVLVATDVAARGVDFEDLRNVVLYDMPYSAADLLHRAGRTGRLGKKGRVSLLVQRKEAAGWVRGLETIVRKGMALA